MSSSTDRIVTVSPRTDRVPEKLRRESEMAAELINRVLERWSWPRRGTPRSSLDITPRSSLDITASGDLSAISLSPTTSGDLNMTLAAASSCDLNTAMPPGSTYGRKCDHVPQELRHTSEVAAELINRVLDKMPRMKP